MSTPAEIRVQYIHSLMGESSEDITREFRQLMLDVLDIVQQEEEEEYILAALNGFENAIKNKQKKKSGKRKKKKSELDLDKRCFTPFGPDREI